MMTKGKGNLSFSSLFALLILWQKGLKASRQKGERDSLIHELGEAFLTESHIY